jgi:hypothetical protein
MDHEICILPDGTIRCLYHDALKPIFRGGKGKFRRASHVDPKMTEKGVGWFVDLSPVKGPELGPYKTRDAALKAEIKWLEKNRLARPM